jgi:hypothetical protein
VESERLGVERHAARDIADVEHGMVETLDRHGGLL